MKDMTIAQALRRVKILKGEIAEFRARAARSLIYREDQPPAYAFQTCMEAIGRTREELEGLQSAVRITNAKTVVALDFPSMKGSYMLTTLVRTLEGLKDEIAWLKTLACLDQPKLNQKERDWDENKNEWTQKSYVQICSYPVATRDSRIKDLQTLFDGINDAVERANHTTVLAT